MVWCVLGWFGVFPRFPLRGLNHIWPCSHFGHMTDKLCVVKLNSKFYFYFISSSKLMAHRGACSDGGIIVDHTIETVWSFKAKLYVDHNTCMLRSVCLSQTNYDGPQSQIIHVLNLFYWLEDS